MTLRARAEDRPRRRTPITAGRLTRAALVSLSLAGLALASCRRRDAIASPDSVTLMVNNQPVAFALLELSRVSGWPVVLAPSATEVAACVRISVLAAQPVPRAQLRRLVLGALEPTPLAVQEQAGGWIVRRRDGAQLPDSCSSLAFRETSLADIERRRRERQGLLASEAPSADGDGGAGAALQEETRVAAILAGITATGENTYSVTREALDAMLSESEALGRRVRIVPHTREGAIRGMKLFGIRRGSVFAALGMQNGDSVESVNGVAMSSPELVLEAYSRIRNAPEIRVVLERSGAQQTLTYRLTGPTQRR
ncbi:MAG: hypothetical protein JNK05_20895 [Myxococcales bacterium]|nr:hypothetical protein [Myxococcales bacterium]